MHKLGYFLEQMQARNVPLPRLLEGSGIAAQDLDLKSLRPDITQFRQVIRNIVAVSPPGIGLELGLGASIHIFGVLGYLVLSSPNFRECNRLLKKYFNLVEDFSFYSGEITDTEWRIEFKPQYPMGDVTPFVFEELFARSKAEFLIYIGGPVEFKALNLVYPPPPYSHLYDEIFQCPIRFNQERNLLLLDAKYLDLPIAFSNSQICRLCEEQCAQMLTEMGDARQLEMEIRRRLILNPGKYPSLTEMSTTMKLSPRVLARKLKDEGTSYQNILDSVRRELAIQYLANTKLSPKEISFQLGFNNVHNFRRAFKGWTGFYPSHYQSPASVQ